VSGPDPYFGDFAASIESLFEGTLSAEETERVTRAVAEDREAAELYWDYVELHTELRRLHQGKAAPAPAGPGEAAAPPAGVPGASLGDVSEPPSAPTSGGGIAGVLGVVTLVLGGSLCVCGLVAWLGWLGPHNNQAPGSRSGPIARVTSLSDCTWAGTGAENPLAPGSPLASGDYVRIRDGSLKLTYENGVEVTLSGTTCYRVMDEKYGILQDGSALARVPKHAIGFTINTPAGGIIDCGTEFVVSVGKDAKTGVATAEVNVIEGAVAASPGSGTKQRQFKAGESLRMSSLNNGSKHPKATDTFDPRTLPGLRLWLNADAGVLRGPSDRVTEMIDLIGGSNVTAENAKQPSGSIRPRWLSGTINHRPTLAFEGKHYIQLSSPSDLDFQDESVSIFVVGNASGGTQYFLSSRADGENNDPRGFRFTSSLEGGLRYQAAGVTVVQPCDMRQHAVFSVIHDRRVPGENTVTLYRNGRQLGPAVKVGDTNISNAFPLTIGANLEAIRKYPKSSKNYLRGDLGEILIFDCVLTRGQREQVETYLIRKYGFVPDTDRTQDHLINPPAPTAVVKNTF